MSEPQAVVVSVLDVSDSVAAGEVLSGAFQTDPLWVATLRDADRRPEMLARMFTGLIRATIAARGIVERTPLLEGVALWLPPGRDIGGWAMARSGFAMPRFVMSLPKRDRQQMLAVLRQVGERRKALMPEPHWYVPAVGVDPQRHGEGFGSALMRHGTARADHGEASIYLETEAGENVSFYQDLGFEVMEVITLQGVDIPMWLMARRPRSPHP